MYSCYIHVCLNNLVAEAHKYIFQHSLISRVKRTRIHGYTVHALRVRRSRNNEREYKIASRNIEKVLYAGRFRWSEEYLGMGAIEREKRARVGETKRAQMYTDYQKGRLGIPIRYSRLTRRSNSNQPPLNPAPFPDSAYRATISRIDSVWLRGEAISRRLVTLWYGSCA